MRMSVRSGYRLGPVSNKSLRATPEVEFAEASKTGLSFVVVHISLNTPCTGK